MRHSLLSLACLLLVLSLTACNSPKLEPLLEDDIILAFGDSLTAGNGTKKIHSYPSVLAELSGVTVVNAGISGETTDRGLKRLPKELEKHNPALLILLEGGNDILRNTDAASTKRNLKKMIEIAEEHGVQVVLLGVPEKNLFSDSAPFYSELAEEHDLVFDAELISRIMRSPSKKADPVHFNQEGYREMAESIYELLVEQGALEE